MAVYAVTGKLGAGKSLYSVFKIQQYLFQKRRVAANFDISIAKLLSPDNKTANVCRLPDMPTADDIKALGRGDGMPEDSDFYDESKFGVIVLDEAALWLNSHDYNKGGRRDLFNLFILIRKMCWDVYILIQNIDVLDTQLRKSICEHVVYLMRLDRVKLPIISQLGYILTFGFWSGHLPRMHHAVIRYGVGVNAMRVGSEQFRGTTLYGAYNTRQKFYENSQSQGTYCTLPPWYTRVRLPASPFNRAFVMRLTKIYWKRLNRLLCVLLGGVLVAVGFSFFNPPASTNVGQVVSKKTSHSLSLEPYRDFKILSSRLFKNQWFYVLSNADRRVTSDDLISLGFGVYPLGAGQLKLIAGDDSIFIFR